MGITPSDWVIFWIQQCFSDLVDRCPSRSDHTITNDENLQAVKCVTVWTIDFSQMPFSHLSALRKGLL